MGADPLHLALELRPPEQPTGEFRWIHAGGEELLGGQVAEPIANCEDVRSEAKRGGSYRRPGLGVPRAAGRLAGMHTAQDNPLNPSVRSRLEPQRLACQRQRLEDGTEYPPSCSASMATTRCDGNGEGVPLSRCELNRQLVDRRSEQRIWLDG